MPSGPRPTSRPGAGPGRGKPRARTAPRQPAPQPRASRQDVRAAEQSAVEEEQSAAAVRRRSSLTTRAIALAVVFLILTISYATSLRIFFAQSSEIAATQQEISQRQQRISDLQTDLSRWNDDAYVKTQARARLGWVMPGETGFKVVDKDGKALDGGAEINAPKKATPPKDAWWDKLWGSVEAADKPAPVKTETKPTKEPTITQDTKPSVSPTPR